MDLDYNLQIITATYAVSYLEKAICGIDKYIDILPTDDYKAQVIATKRLYGEYLKKLKEWIDSQEKIGGIKMNNDIRKLIDDNWEDIKELIAQKAEAEQKPKTIWDLNIEDREEYYGIEPDGEVMRHMFDDVFDEDAREMGNAFLTEEEAEFEAERRKVEAIMRKYSSPFSPTKSNWYITYDPIVEEVIVRVTNEVILGIPYFKQGMAEKVIDKIGTEILTHYWFGVK